MLRPGTLADLATLSLVAALAAAGASACATPAGATPGGAPPSTAPAPGAPVEWAALAAKHGALAPEYVDVLKAAGVDAEALRCTPTQTWSESVGPEARFGVEEILAAVEARGGPLAVAAEERGRLEEELEELVRWRLVRVILLGGNHNNLGVVAVRGATTAEGRPLMVYRTGITPTPAAEGSCFRSLVEAGGVRHGVNLYAGAIPTRDLDEAEQRTLEDVGGTYFLGRTLDPGSSSWRAMMREDPAKTAQAMQAVARIVNEQILRPGGRAPKGHVLVHCGGGMHRTGMVVGVIQRCINGDPPEVIERQYKRHTAWRSDADPGGFEQENLDFVSQFDCGLLVKPEPAVSPPSP